MRQIYQKLVRDLIPARLTAAGQRYEARVLNEADYRTALLAKLVEEAQEVQAAEDIADVVAELADVAEVMAALMDAYGIDPAQVRLAQDEKRAERGGFEGRVELVWVEEV
ncbi:MAG: nucleoside triphosphate pyrophosphohydrolase [Cyanobacteria bacterium J06629_9]